MSAVVRALLLVASLAAVRAQRCADDYAPSAAQEPAIARLPFYQSFEDIDSVVAEDWSAVSIDGTEAAGCSSWRALLVTAQFERSRPGSCHSGEGCWATGALTHNANENSALLTPPFDFSAVSGAPRVAFWLAIDTLAVRDGAWLEATRDNGASWNVVGAVGSDWYGSSVPAPGQGIGATETLPAFGGRALQWRLVQSGVPGVAGAARAQFRLRFKALGGANGRAGVLFDDFVVSRSAIPACPPVVSPANGAVVDPKPLTIRWEATGAVSYTVALAQQGGPSYGPIGAGTGRVRYTTPPLALGDYTYRVAPVEPDNTTNYWCPERLFTAAFTNRGAIPHAPSFATGAGGGWQNVDYDDGRFVLGQSPALSALNGAPASYAYVGGGSLNPVTLSVFESPVFNFARLPAAVLTFKHAYSFTGNSGASVQFSLDRGQTWTAVGAPGVDTWHTASNVGAFTFFSPPNTRVAGFTGQVGSWKTATYKINDATMPASWFSCSEEVMFRVAVAIGASANSAGYGFGELTLEPDLDMVGAECVGDPAPPFAPPARVTPAPTPPLPPTDAPTPAPTVTVEPTPAPTPFPTPPPTPATPMPTPPPTPLPPGDTLAPTPVPPATGTSAPTPLLTEVQDTFAPTPVRFDATSSEDMGSEAPMVVEVETDGGGLSPGIIILLAILACLLCLLLLLLALFFLRKRVQKEKEEEKKRDADAENLAAMEKSAR